MSIFLIAVMILMYTLQSFFCKIYSESYPGDKNYASSVFSIVSGVIVAFVSFLVAGLSLSPSWQTMLLGAVNGVVLIAYNAFMVKASENGPYSVLMVFMLSGGIIIPAIASRIMGDEFTVFKWLTILVIVLATWMVSKKREDTAVANKSFYPACIGLFLFNGVYGMLFDVQQRITGVGEKEEMVISSYIVMAVISFLFLVFKRKGEVFSDFKQTKKSGLFLILCSLAVAGAINLLVFIIPLVDVTVLYTFDNAGVFLVSVICSCIFFKEKLTPLNIAGCVVMCAGLVCMSLL